MQRERTARRRSTLRALTIPMLSPYFVLREHDKRALVWRREVRAGTRAWASRIRVPIPLKRGNSYGDIFLDIQDGCRKHPQKESIAQCYSCGGYVCADCIRIEQPKGAGEQRVNFFHVSCLPSGIRPEASLLQGLLGNTSGRVELG